MTNLLYKDWVLNKQNIAIFALLIVVNMSWFAWQGAPAHIYYFFGALIAGFVPVSLLIQEEKFHSVVLSCSLPVDRNLIVRSKYVGGWIAGVLVLVLITFLPLAIPGAEWRPWRGLAGGGWLAGLFGLTLVIGGLVPFSMRFGFVGVLVLLVALQLGGALSMLVMVVTPEGRVVVGAVLGFLPKIFEWMRGVLGVQGFMVVGAAVLLMLNVLSYELSCRLFRTKDL